MTEGGSDLKPFYRVTTTFDDKGICRSFVETVSADSKPANTFVSTNRFDIYEDYFDIEEEAVKFAREAEQA